MLAVFTKTEASAGKFVHGDGQVSDDLIAKDILKFVRQLDGADTDERVLKSAIERRWLDIKGLPTPDGRSLIKSFDDLQSLGRATA